MNQPIHRCEQCGAAVLDRGVHGAWHIEMARTLAPDATDHRVLEHAQ